MHLSTSEAAPAFDAHCSVTARLCALALWLASGCTDPTFTRAEDAGDEAQNAASSEEQRNRRDEVTDAGTERPGPREEVDGASKAPDSGAQDGGGPPVRADCEGGACDMLDARAASGPEAGAGASAADAGARLDEARAKWAGRYAARSAMFAFDDTLNGTARMLSVIQIVPTAEGGLRLEEELCDYEGAWSLGGVSGGVKHRFGDARSSAALQYDAERFSSEQLAASIGYGATPAGCNPGATLPRQADQAWLTSTCDCPRSNELPTSARDCRLTDPDKDSQPGATLSVSVFGSPSMFRVAQELRARLLAGYRRGDRLYAERWFEENTHLLSCAVNGAPAPASSCPVTPSESCPSQYNKMELVPIEEPIKCAQVNAMETALFLSPLPGFPVNCPSEVDAGRTP